MRNCQKKREILVEKGWNHHLELKEQNQGAKNVTGLMFWSKKKHLGNHKSQALSMIRDMRKIKQ